MKRATDPAHLEAIANHPRVRPYIGGHGEFRAGESWARTIAFEWPEGGVVFVREAPHLYSAHLVFLPKTPDVIGKVRQAIAAVFALDARALTATFPTRYRHVRAIALACGFAHLFDCNDTAYWRLRKA